MTYFVFGKYLVRISAGSPTLLIEVGVVQRASRQITWYWLKSGHDWFLPQLSDSLKAVIASLDAVSPIATLNNLWQIKKSPVRKLPVTKGTSVTVQTDERSFHLVMSQSLLYPRFPLLPWLQFNFISLHWFTSKWKWLTSSFPLPVHLSLHSFSLYWRQHLYPTLNSTTSNSQIWSC